MSSRIRAIDKHLIAAETIGRARVEKLAYAAMRRYPHCKSFAMGMGLVAFYRADGHSIDTTHHAYDALYNFLAEYDDALKLTGDPMNLNAPQPKGKTDANSRRQRHTCKAMGRAEPTARPLKLR